MADAHSSLILANYYPLFMRALNGIMEYKLIRTLTCYSNSDERIAFDVQLEKFDLAGFQKEFGIEENNPMYDSYEVKVKNVPFIKSFERNMGSRLAFCHLFFE